MILSLRYATRELRAGLAGLRVVLACLALGVAAIAAVGSLRDSIDRGLAENARRLLGGDLEVQGGAQPLPDALRQFLRNRGARLSDVITLRSMLIAANGERQLIELKAVDAQYPLVGAADSQPGPVQALLGQGGIVVDPLVLERLRVGVGAALTLGDAHPTLRGTLQREPDRIGAPLFGPPALVSLQTLDATHLVQPGSLLSHDLRVVLPDGADPAATEAAVRAAFPGTGWRLRLATDPIPNLGAVVDQTALFLSLVGLSALLVGGIGVANGVRAWLDARARSIAVLRCLGASTGTIFAIYVVQVGALALLGTAIGVAAGAGLSAGAVALFGDALPVPAHVGLYPAPLALAALFGLLTAATFTLWPLARAAQIPGAALFRDALIPTPLRRPVRLVAANAVFALLLAAATVGTAPDRPFAAGFCAAAAATMAAFWLGGRGLSRLARRIPPPRAAGARLGLANLHRPGAATGSMLLSLGLGLSTLAAVALVQGNIREAVTGGLAADAPSFFFIDIQPDQLDRFRQVLAQVPGVERVDEVPSLRARIVSVDGVPADQVHATPESQWALRGDRGLTYSRAVPDGSRLVAGTWWAADYDGPPLVSMDATIARGWGLHLGSTLRVNVLGRDIDLRVASLRAIDWRSLGINFTLVASPGLLERAPHTHIATVWSVPGADATILRRVTDALPNVSGIRVADILGAVVETVGKLAAALAAAGSVTLAAGALVLASAVAAGQRRRRHEAIVLKTLGATRSQIRAAWLTEFGLIGATAGILSALVGSAASWAVMRTVLHAEWSFLPGRLALTLAGCVLLMVVIGYAGTEAALRARPAPYLRNE